MESRWWSRRAKDFVFYVKSGKWRIFYTSMQFSLICIVNFKILSQSFTFLLFFFFSFFIPYLKALLGFFFSKEIKEKCIKDICFIDIGTAIFIWILSIMESRVLEVQICFMNMLISSQNKEKEKIISLPLKMPNRSVIYLSMPFKSMI